MISIITSLIYGLSVAVALVVGSFLLWKAAKKADLDSELIFDWSILMVFFGIISGRLFSLDTFYQISRYFRKRRDVWRACGRFIFSKK